MDKEETIGRKDYQIEELASQLKKLQDLNAQNGASSSELSKELATFKQKLEAAEQAFQKLQKELEGKIAENKLLAAEIESLKKTIVLRDNTILNKDTEISSLSTKLAEMNDALKKSEREINELKKAYAA